MLLLKSWNRPLVVAGKPRRCTMDEAASAAATMAQRASTAPHPFSTYLLLAQLLSTSDLDNGCQIRSCCILTYKDSHLCDLLRLPVPHSATTHTFLMGFIHGGVSLRLCLHVRHSPFGSICATIGPRHPNAHSNSEDYKCHCYKRGGQQADIASPWNRWELRFMPSFEIALAHLDISPRSAFLNSKRRQRRGILPHCVVHIRPTWRARIRIIGAENCWIHVRSLPGELARSCGYQ